MRQPLFAAFIAICAPFSMAQGTAIIEVAPGDLEELVVAIEQANDQAPARTIIRSTGEFQIPADSAFPTIKGRVHLEGYPQFIRFTPVDVGPDQLFSVQPEAQLTLENIELQGFSLAKNSSGLLQNAGSLALTRVQFNEVATFSLCTRAVCTPTMPAIRNESTGMLTLQQVSFVDSGISSFTGLPLGGIIDNEGEVSMVNSQVYLTQPAGGEPFRNAGSMRFRYVSLMSTIARPLVFSESGALTRIQRSAIQGFREGCDGVTSGGYNVTDDPGCQLTRPTDQAGTSPSLLWRPAVAEWNPIAHESEILTHALTPQASSPAVDLIPFEFCQSSQLPLRHRSIQDGNGDGVYACDAGAVELLEARLDEGGINGLYHVRDTEGHLVYVLDNDANTLLIWTTFDLDGNQVWILALGELTDQRSMVAEAYRSRDGALRPGGELDPAVTEPWGSISLEMQDCGTGLMRYESTDPAFGTGQIAIQRLAYVKQLGCVDDND